MKIQIFIITIWCFATYGFSANKSNHGNIDFYLIDSLNVNDLNNNDRELIDSMLNIYHAANQDTAKYSALTILIEECWNDAVWPRYNEFLVTSIENKLKGNLSSYERLKLLNLLADGYNNAGYIATQRGNIHKGLAYFKQALTIEETTNDKTGIAHAINNIGYIYNQNGDIQNAIKYFHKSLKLHEETKDKAGIARAYNNIANVYEHQNDLEKAIEYYQKSLEIKQEINDQTGIANTLINLASLNEGIDQVGKAMEYFLKSLEIHQSLGDKIGQAQTLNNMGYLYKKHGNLIKAKECFRQSFQLNGISGNTKSLAKNLINLGECFFLEGNVDSAVFYVRKGLQFSRDAHSVRGQKEASKLLHIILKEQGNYKEALNHFENYIQFRDSLLNEENQKASIKQQTKYEFEKKQLIEEQQQKELLRMKEEEMQRRNNLQYSIIFIAILCVFGLVLALGKIQVSVKVAEGLIFFAFLILFEFLLVLSDPYVEEITGGAPGLKLLINALFAAVIFPAHSFFERTLKKRIMSNKSDNK